MVTLTIGLFACAAVLGIVLAILHFTNKKMPLALAVFHGLFAVAAVLMLIVAVMKLAAAGLLGIALTIFVIAALGGLFLFLVYYLPRKKLPSAIVVLHGLLAVTGFVLLLVFAFSH